MIAATPISLNRSQRLQLTIAPALDGTAVAVDGTWDVAAAISRDAAGKRRVADVPTTIDASDRIAIDFDTVDLPAGYYWFQVRITAPGEGDQYTLRRQMILLPIIPDPSDR
jgi:hypothetical protein